jgi:hypothetical protein
VPVAAMTITPSRWSSYYDSLELEESQHSPSIPSFRNLVATPEITPNDVIAAQQSFVENFSIRSTPQPLSVPGGEADLVSSYGVGISSISNFPIVATVSQFEA